MIYEVKTATATQNIEGPPRLTFRQILAKFDAPITFPLEINDYKVLERDNLDRTLPAYYLI